MENPLENNPLGDTQTGFLGDVARYFRDFLDTDFRRQRLPKRSISRKDRGGNLTGISLKKYPTLIQMIWGKLHQAVGGQVTFKIPRGRYKAKINPQLTNLIEKYIESITETTTHTLIDKAKLISRTLIKTHQDDPERLTAEVMSGLEREVGHQIVVPILKHLESYFGKNNVQGLETIFDIQDELGQRLVANAEEAIGASLNTAIISKDFTEYDQLVSDLFDLVGLQTKILDYFETFTASDFYSELHTLRATLRIYENMDIYLYVGDLHYTSLSFPLFYLPLHVELIESVFNITIDPHLYINKKAVDYVSQEIARSEKKTTPSLVTDRIIYLEPDQSFGKIIQNMVDKWTSDMALRPPIDYSKPQEQKSRSSQAIISNRLYFSAFDKSDEALLNDYEALLTMVEGGDSVIEDFKKLVDSFLFGDPDSITTAIDLDWQNTHIQDRLVCRSPIPLNEEQRKIQSAVKSKDGRFIICSGPPGTGKSHTITAIAFDAILDGRNVLILSDKTEALNVVEDKLTKTLDSVRVGENFQNPILRLGKSSNTYHKIVSTQSIEKIKAYHRTAQANHGNLQHTIEKEDNLLRGQIKKAAEVYQGIDIQSIYALQREEKELSKDIEGIASLFNDTNTIQTFDDIRALADLLENDDFALMNVLRGAVETPTLKDLELLVEVQPHLAKLDIPSQNKVAIKLFNRIYDHQLDKLGAFIRQYEEIRYPVIGFLFSRKKARIIDSNFGKAFDCRSALDVHRNLRQLRRCHEQLAHINQVLVQNLGSGKHLCYAFQLLIHDYDSHDWKPNVLRNCISRIKKFIADHPECTKNIGLNTENLADWLSEKDSVDKSLLRRVLDFQLKYENIRKKFSEIPVYDYAGQKSKLENLHAEVLANTIDDRVISFHEKKRTTANAIRDIIRKKQKFPKDQFDDLKNAFPCIIANIRDYAEYMPLAPELFDVIVIDEASQVSIAQAFPAILRSKKLVVLGDAKQFSNVKTSNASKAINNQYTNAIRDNFVRTHRPDSNLLNRLEKFNIKTSILDFVDMIANYGAMLKKHFRGYKEHISYSSKFFYSGQLQAVKVRGKPIEDVMEFTLIEDDGKRSVLGNVNELEGDFIIGEIERLLEFGDPPSVGIITPFTDQQRYLSKVCHKHSRGQEMYERLQLKIMTFDSCQGEEREYVYYSMVATRDHDRLYGIFPKSFQDAGDPELSLRLQRLNVGFSRVQEKMHFVVSKPVEEFSGALGEALRHYQNIFEQAKDLPTSDDVDPMSPMEAKVLEWIQQTEFYQNQMDQIEIVTQFPIGDYLKQLDHTYNHPAYRTDFLLKFRVNERIFHIIIEYDGFKEHFTNLDEIDAGNYQHYYKGEDVEREKILESYGYKILRINRFNKGKDPVVTLSNRLFRLTRDIMKEHQPHELITKITETAEELVRGDRRVCSRCGQPKPKEAFLDSSLKSGIGRICKECKKGPSSKTQRQKRSSKQQTAKPDPNVKCSRCGSTMVLRKGKYGKFYGCSKFPRCRGTRQYRA